MENCSYRLWNTGVISDKHPTQINNLSIYLLLIHHLHIIFKKSGSSTSQSYLLMGSCQTLQCENKIKWQMFSEILNLTLGQACHHFSSWAMSFHFICFVQLDSMNDSRTGTGMSKYNFNLFGIIQMIRIWKLAWWFLPPLKFQINPWIGTRSTNQW